METTTSKIRIDKLHLFRMKFNVSENAKPIELTRSLSSGQFSRSGSPPLSLIVNRGEVKLSRFVPSDLKGCEWRTRRGYLTLEDVNSDGTRMEIDP